MRIRIAATWLILILAAERVGAPPAPPPNYVPGEELGETASHWLAPYTLFTRLSLGSAAESRVQWFDSKGKLLYEIRGMIGENGGYVTQYDSAGFTYYSIADPRWKLYHPKRRDNEQGPGGYLAWTQDGRTYLHSSRTPEFMDYDEWPKLPTTIELYDAGERKTLGPYAGGPRALHLDPSGALAVHFFDGQLYLFDRRGREKLRTHIPPSREHRILSCNEHGVLIANYDETRPIEYIGTNGERASFTIPGHSFPTWVDARRAVFYSYLHGLVLVDCPSGREEWTSPPGSKLEFVESIKMAVAGPYLLVAGVQPNRSDAPAVYQLGILAFRLETGELVARWKEDCTSGTGRRFQFFERDRKLYFIEAKRFCEIRPGDIEGERAGWRSALPPKPEPPRFEEGPAASPITWTPIGSQRKARDMPFAPRQKISAADLQPASVQLVDLRDARPYGEIERRTAWLARYDSVVVQPDSARSTHVTLYAAFDAATGNLVCAFTPAAARWTLSRQKPIDMQARFKESVQSDLSPADYPNLQSTPADVLGGAVYARFIDPSVAGQIVLRPRFEKRSFGYKPFEGKLLPLNPPSNAWVVEILGMPFDREHGFASFVFECRDADLAQSQGMAMP